jgi:hypothetical protein
VIGNEARCEFCREDFFPGVCPQLRTCSFRGSFNCLTNCRGKCAEVALAVKPA